MEFLGGVTDHEITLAAAWVFGNVSEVEIILHKQMLHPFNLYSFCFLDTIGVNIKSRVFIKRETHRIEAISGPSELRWILAAEPLGSELQFAAGTKFVLRVRIQMMIH